MSPDIFALVTCLDCYQFMPNTQFKPRRDPSLTSNINSSSQINGGKNIYGVFMLFKILSTEDTVPVKSNYLP